MRRTERKNLVAAIVNIKVYLEIKKLKKKKRKWYGE